MSAAVLLVCAAALGQPAPEMPGVDVSRPAPAAAPTDQPAPPRFLASIPSSRLTSSICNRRPRSRARRILAPDAAAEGEKKAEGTGQPLRGRFRRQALVQHPRPGHGRQPGQLAVPLPLHWA